MKQARSNALRRALGALVLVTLPLVATALVWAQRVAADRNPADPDWSALAEKLRGRIGEGDVIRIVPSWDNRGRSAFFAAVPGAGAWPFRALDWREPADPILWMRYRRLVFVGWTERVEAAIAGAPEGSAPAEDLARAGRLLARAVGLPPSPLRWSGVDHLADAEVRRIPAGGSPVRCPWRHDRHDCPGGAEWWRDVRVRLVDAGDAPRECIYAEPSTDGGRVEVRFPRVPLRPGEVLLLRAGNTIQGARKPAGGTLGVEMRLDGRLVVDDRYHRNDYLWIPWVVEAQGPSFGLRDRPGVRDREVVVTVWAEKAGWRQECFDLQVLAQGWEAWGPVGFGHPYRGMARTVPVRQGGLP